MNILHEKNKFEISNSGKNKEFDMPGLKDKGGNQIERMKLNLQRDSDRSTPEIFVCRQTTTTQEPEIGTARVETKTAQ